MTTVERSEGTILDDSFLFLSIRASCPNTLSRSDLMAVLVSEGGMIHD